MNLVERWRDIETSLSPGWSDATLALTVNDAECARATALLGPLGPVRSGNTIRVYASRGRADSVRRLLAGLDREGITGTLEVTSSQEVARPEPAEERSLAQSWGELAGGLPEDWSDLYCEIQLESTDYLEPGALRMAPLNPARAGEGATFRFRCARRFGYGASPGMVSRCLERLDEAGITGQVRILRALSDTKPVGTQGPVWYLAGKSV